MTVLIKRYANRKLYNTETSRYITLKGIAELLEQDQEVKVIDNETGEDITSVALSQILVDSERSGNTVPGNLISDLIQKGGDALYGALRGGEGATPNPLGEIQKGVRRMMRREDAGDWIAFSKPDFDKLLQNAMERVLRVLDLPRRTDIDALNENLSRVADALERLEPSEPSVAAPPEEEARRYGES